MCDRAETITNNPGSVAAWKRECESIRAQLTTLTAKLEAAEKDAARYTYLLHNMGLVEAHARTWVPKKHKPLLLYVQDFIDAEINKDALFRDGVGKE